MRIAVDLSSILWACLRTGKDPEGELIEHEGRKVQVNKAEHGYEIAVNCIAAALNKHSAVPMNLIFAEEGINPKRHRLVIDQYYKAKRGTKAPQELEQFQRLKDMFLGEFMNLGAIKVTQDNVEGDDVLAWLAQNSEEDLVVLTFDNDLMALQGKNTHGASVEVQISGEVGVNKYGDFDHKLITLYKALVGDSSDNIKGCPGFGPAAFASLYAAWGEAGLFELAGCLDQNNLRALDSLHGKDKLITLILDNEKAVIKAWKLAKLHPEWVNTLDTPLQWQGGIVLGTSRDERLRKFAQKKRLITTANLVDAYNFLKTKLPETLEPTFDIETSPLEESEDWMVARGKEGGVDVLGHRLTGFSLTFGNNMQYTYYVSVDHKDTANISMEDARTVLELVWSTGKHVVIQNTMFEGTVMALSEDNGMTWEERWKDNGYRGFIPNWLDTVFEASYVDENEPLGLKQRSKLHLGYDQKSFEETTCKSGFLEDLPAGGRLISKDGEMPRKQYVMRELTAEEVFDYGCDDTICTAALHNFYKLVMQLEHTWQVYLQVEIDASYQHLRNFLDGKHFSLEKMRELEKIDNETFDKAWAVIRAYLMKHGWAGTVPPTYGADITAKQIKEAYAIWTGQIEADEEDDDEEAEELKPSKDIVLSSRVRTPAKFLPLLRAAEVDEVFCRSLEALLAGGSGEEFTQLVRSRFSGEPQFKVSNKQMSKLLYEVMELPIEIRKKPTKTMRAKGIREGTPSTDALAIKYALRSASDEVKPVLEALQLYQMVKTRRGLYYEPYPGFIHWSDGLIHSSHRQCGTNTRRAAVAEPNDQQMPKHAKVEGQPARFRECIVPHKPNAVVFSLDFVQQELVLIAEESQDPNMLACYVGDNLKDMHILTAVGIAASQHPELNWDYAEFVKHYNNPESEHHKLAKKLRAQGKQTNFTTEYGAMATKLSQTMLVTEAEAQTYIDAKEDTFEGVRVWKDGVIAEAKETGIAKTRMGAVRHLGRFFRSDDRWESSKAERQAVNYKIQGGSAEQTKLAEGRMWRKGLSYVYDAKIYGPIHDEVAGSVVVPDLLPFLKDMHWCMTQQYAGMKIPNRSSISFGPSFGEQIEIGEDPTQEAINRGLKLLADKLIAASAAQASNSTTNGQKEAA